MQRRYNSVERFTSVHLTEYEQQQLVSPPPADQQQLMIPSAAEHPSTFPSSTTPSPIQVQAFQPHPFSLLRRRSHEQLLPPPATSSFDSAVPRPQSGVGMAPPRPSGPPSPASTAMPLSQQPQPTFPAQYPQYVPSPQPVPLPRSFLRQPQLSYATQPYESRFPQQNRIGPHPGAVPPPLAQSSLQFRAPQPSLRSSQQQLPGAGGQDEGGGTSLLARIPAVVWLSLSVIEIIVGIVSLFIGGLNASPYNCLIEPNIPVYLILSGVLLIINGGARVFITLSAPSADQSKRNHGQEKYHGQHRQERQKAASGKRTWPYAVEGVGLFCIVVVVILGCVWVYGAARYMHSQMYMFERQFCEHFLYWASWWSVTIHLVVFALLILLGIVILVFGALS